MRKILFILLVLIPNLLLSQWVGTGIKLGTGFEVQSSKPLDVSMYPADENEKNALNTYDGKIVRQADDGTWYEWDEANQQWTRFPQLDGLVTQIPVFDANGDLVGYNAFTYSTTGGLSLLANVSITGYIDFTGVGNSDIVKINGQRFLYADRSTPFNTSFGLGSFANSTGITSEDYLSTALGYRNAVNVEVNYSTFVGSYNAFHTSTYLGTYDYCTFIGYKNVFGNGTDLGENKVFDYLTIIGNLSGHNLPTGSGNNIIIGNSIYSRLSPIPTEPVRDKLLIGSVPSEDGDPITTSLLYGDMIEQWLRINGDLIVTGDISSPGSAKWSQDTTLNETYIQNPVVVGGKESDTSANFTLYGNGTVYGNFHVEGQITSKYSINVRTEDVSPEGKWDFKDDLTLSEDLIMKVYSQATAPDIPNNSLGLWIDTDDNKQYIIFDAGGTQKMVELTL